MKRFSLGLGVIFTAMVAAACGGGTTEQQNMNNMPASNTQTPAQAPATPSAPAGNVEITLTSQPDPPKTGETTLRRW